MLSRLQRHCENLRNTFAHYAASESGDARTMDYNEFFAFVNECELLSDGLTKQDGAITTRPLSLTRAHHASPFRRPPTGASPHALPTMIRILRLLHDAYTHNMLTCCNPLLQRSTSC
jgi:hypothetical protein